MRISDWISDVCSSDLSKLPLNEKNEPDSDSDTTPLKCWKMLASSLITDVPCCLTSSVALMNAWSTPCSSPLLPTATKPRPFSFSSTTLLSVTVTSSWVLVERRDGKESVSTVRTRGSRSHTINRKHQK